MTIDFYLQFNTRFGQNVFVVGNIAPLGNNKPTDALALAYSDGGLWRASIQIDEKQITTINYRYILREEDSPDLFDADADRVIEPAPLKGKDIAVVDVWNDEGAAGNVFYTKPFAEVLLPQVHRIPKLKSPGSYTHRFNVKAPLLLADEFVCITGAGKMFRYWDVKKLLPLTPSGNWYSININLGKESFPLEYKYGIYNAKNKTFVYEEGANRLLAQGAAKKQITILHDGLMRTGRTWRGAGIAIPVFSLRSKNGAGTGEFNDIKLLADWAKRSGISLLQLLPVNDTTATHTAKDSYPYSAISAFALHPLYINLETVAGNKHLSMIKRFDKEKKILDLSSLDYPAVIKFKISVLREIYRAQKNAFLVDKSFIEFFNVNREWLEPYAAYCFLRNKNGTADFATWRTNKVYNAEAIRKFASPSQPHYDEICFHYFIQYHLHVQLKAASEYAHKKGVVVKGDIPIGVSPHSCDVWMNPSLFNTHEQAGAPPDPFAVKGQNWGFPTYNWKKMQEDNYAWWRKRFAQMNNYFDAFRIDHILGFFRIWSIPDRAVEGILGRFVPAVPVHITEFHKRGIWFDHGRYCKPFINENILLQFFGDDLPLVKKIFLQKEENDTYQLKEQFDTQLKIQKYFEGDPGDEKLKGGLFNLVSNIILIEEEGSQLQSFHFRISMQQTTSFQNLDPHTQQQLNSLYLDYFFKRQDILWKKEALKKLPALKRSTPMLICGEDLGMLSHCVPEVMQQTGILSLEIQRMPKDPSVEFFHPRNAPYLSVVTPSTHDMSTLREWWQEDMALTQRFYNFVMGRYGQAPAEADPAIIKEIILQHAYSPAMWSIFQLQDLLAMSQKLRRDDPREERINIPADPDHYWKYRMHITLEELMSEKHFSKELKIIFTESGRA